MQVTILSKLGLLKYSRSFVTELQINEASLSMRRQAASSVPARDTGFLATCFSPRAACTVVGALVSGLLLQTGWLD